MLPFTFVDKIKNKRYKCGLFLADEKTGENILKENNFAFKFDYIYYTKTFSAYIPNGNSSENMSLEFHKGSGKKIIDSQAHTRYTLDINFATPFILLDDNDEITYPFGCITVGTFKSKLQLSKFSMSADTSKIFSKLKLPICGIENESLIKKISKQSGVDITPLINYYKKLVKSDCYNFAEVPITVLNNYIEAYKCIPNFKVCINNGLTDSYNWLKYTMPTIRKKAKEAVAVLGNTPINTFPSYVLSRFKGKPDKGCEKNIISLYKLGFREEDYNTFDKLFGKYSDNFIKHFFSLYDFMNDGRHIYTPSDILSMIGSDKSECQDFFIRYNIIVKNINDINRNRIFPVPDSLMLEVKNAIKRHCLISSYERIYDSLTDFYLSTFDLAYKQFPELTFPEDASLTDGTKIFRINNRDEIDDSKRKLLGDNYNNLKKGDIVFFLKDIVYVKGNDKVFLYGGIANVIDNRFFLNGLVESFSSYNSDYAWEHSSLLFDSNLGETAYAREYCAKDFIQEIKVCLNKYLFEPYAKTRIKSIF